MLHLLFNWIKTLGDLLLAKGWNASVIRFLSGLFILAVLVVAAIGIYWVVRLVLRKILQRIGQRQKGGWPMIFLKRKMLNFVCYFVLSVIYLKAVPFVFEELPGWIPFMHKVFSLIVLYYCMRVIISVLWSVFDLNQVRSKEQPIALKGLIQFICIVVYFFSVVIAVSILAGKSPLVFIGGLGAASAVLMLVFKDSITGLVAGVQLARNDMVRIGDWITIPGQGVDGTVIDISLTTVKVRNFDLTILMVPTYLLITQSVQNWRGLRVWGGRRMMRTIYIDLTTIHLCTPDMLRKFMQIDLLKGFLQEKLREMDAENEKNGVAAGDLLNARSLTNLEVFMKYLELYLTADPDIRKDPEASLLVRQLQAEDVGMPVQMYCYTKTADWGPHENTVSRIMSHVVAMVPFFGLSVYERSAQTDHRNLAVDSQ